MVVVGGAYKIDSRRHTIVKFSSTGRDGPLSHDLGRLHIFVGISFIEETASAKGLGEHI